MYDHLPTPDELLDARIAAGWTPTPSSTVNGGVIEGFACTRFGMCG